MVEGDDGSRQPPPSRPCLPAANGQKKKCQTKCGEKLGRKVELQPMSYEKEDEFLPPFFFFFFFLGPLLRASRCSRSRGSVATISKAPRSVAILEMPFLFAHFLVPGDCDLSRSLPLCTVSCSFARLQIRTDRSTLPALSPTDTRCQVPSRPPLGCISDQLRSINTTLARTSAHPPHHGKEEGRQEGRCRRFLGRSRRVHRQQQRRSQC